MSSKKNIDYYLKTKRESLIFNTINVTLLLLISFATLYPFWNTIVISLNDATDTLTGGLSYWPRVFTLQNYKTVFATGTIPHALWISVARTVLGTIISVYLTSMIAFSLGRKEFVLRKPFTLLLILTMYIQAGLIPDYFLIRDLGMIGTFWVYIFNRGLLSAFNFIVIRTYMTSIPESLVEAARIDGAGDFYIFNRIMLPLAKPVLATIALFVAVGAWNQWFDNMIYNSSKQNLSTLQYELMKFLAASQNQSRSAADIGAMGMAGKNSASMVTPMSIRAAITIVAAAPILLVYPFLQKHFVVGLNVGGVKE